MTKVVLFLLVTYGQSQSATKFEMTTMEECNTQAKYVKEALIAEGYSDWEISALCVMEK